MLLRLVLILIPAAAYLGLAILGWGGFAAFFSHSALIAVTIVFIIQCVAAAFAGGNLSSGEREDRSNRWVITAIIVLGLLAAILPAWTDRLGFWTIDGDSVRWLGVVLFAIGGTLRLWPVFVLGNRFSGFVAIQPEHTLVTTGLYSVIRHPSYLGLLLGTLGWVLVFRSGVGLILTALMVPVIIARIRAEEAMLSSQFGAEYDAFRTHTWRLIPGVY